jgi:hypothetical protein
LDASTASAAKRGRKTKNESVTEAKGQGSSPAKRAKRGQSSSVGVAAGKVGVAAGTGTAAAAHLNVKEPAEAAPTKPATVRKTRCGFYFIF